LHGESSPREPKQVMRRLTPMYHHIRRVIEQGNATYTGPDKITPPRTAIPIAGERREIAERDGFGRPTGNKRLSDWVNYDVKYLGVDAIFDAIRDIRDRAPARGATVQIIYRVRTNHYSPYRRHAVSAAENEATKLKLVLPDMTDGELWSHTLGPLVAAGAHILYIAVVER
jgi:hypothetical protein